MSNHGSKNNVSEETQSKSSKSNLKANKRSESRSKKERLKPLRILIVEPRGRYCKTVWCAIAIGITHLMLGATIMTMMMYSIKTGDAHVSVCTIAGVRGLVSSFPTKIQQLDTRLTSAMRVKVLSLLMWTLPTSSTLYPGGEYWNIIFCHLLVGVAQLCIGGTLAIILMYSLKTNVNDVHVILCTMGYHFFSAEAILCLNYANGWSSPLRLRHRRFAHVFLQMFALVCAITGAALITISNGVSGSAHGITGVITTVLAAITFLSGPCALFGGRYLRLLHVSVGMPTFLMSSVCLCLGTLTTAFRDWAGDSVSIIVIVFVAFYTSFIVITCFMKCVMMI